MFMVSPVGALVGLFVGRNNPRAWRFPARAALARLFSTDGREEKMRKKTRPRKRRNRNRRRNSGQYPFLN
jgi:hypothetical protein